MRIAAILLPAFFVFLLSSAAGAQSQPPQDAEADSPDNLSFAGMSTAKKTTVVTLLALAAASYGVSAYFWVDSASKNGEREDLRAGRPSTFCKTGESDQACSAAIDQYRDKADEQRRSASTAYWMVGVGAGFVVGAAATALLWPNERKSATRLSATPTQSGLALGVSHAF